jgi:serine/threonine protein kinase
MNAAADESHGVGLIEQTILSETRKLPSFVLGRDKDREFAFLGMGWWTSDKVEICQGVSCYHPFGKWIGSWSRHHCRGCGGLFCSKCVKKIETHWHVSKTRHILKYTKAPQTCLLCEQCTPILGYTVDLTKGTEGFYVKKGCYIRYIKSKMWDDTYEYYVDKQIFEKVKVADRYIDRDIEYIGDPQFINQYIEYIKEKFRKESYMFNKFTELANANSADGGDGLEPEPEANLSCQRMLCTKYPTHLSYTLRMETLESLLESDEILQDDAYQQTFRLFVQCLKKFHESSSYHSDIKYENIMLRKRTKDFVLIDFDESVDLSKEIPSEHEPITTLPFAPPWIHQMYIICTDMRNLDDLKLCYECLDLWQIFQLLYCLKFKEILHSYTRLNSLPDRGEDLVDIYALVERAYTIQAAAITGLVLGKTYMITDIGDSDFTLTGAPNNDVGTIFCAIATGVGTGTATVTDVDSIVDEIFKTEKMDAHRIRFLREFLFGDCKWFLSFNTIKSPTGYCHAFKEHFDNVFNSMITFCWDTSTSVPVEGVPVVPVEEEGVPPDTNTEFA